MPYRRALAGLQETDSREISRDGRPARDLTRAREMASEAAQRANRVYKQHDSCVTDTRAPRFLVGFSSPVLMLSSVLCIAFFFFISRMVGMEKAWGWVMF